jgi:CBS domain-containing protein
VRASCRSATILPRVATLRDLIKRDVLAVAPEDTLGEAAEKMHAERIGWAIVSDYGRMIGILTERDILRAVAGRTHSSEARVREWMTPDPVTAAPDTAPEEALKTMLDGGFRHLPVVEDGRPIGVVSMRHVARAVGADT